MIGMQVRLLLVLASYLTLALLFFSATPALEASDEAAHFGHALELYHGGSMLVANPEAVSLAEQEATQAPLYYLVVSRLLYFFDVEDFARLSERRPDAPIGRADIPGYKHSFLNSERGESLNAARALGCMRLFSVVLGLLTVVFCFFTFCKLEPSLNRFAWFPALLVAANPMYLFIMTSVNNDALVTLLCSVVCYVVVSSNGRLALQRTFILGGLLGLAVLSKVSALVYLPALLLYILVVEPKNRRRVLHFAVLFGQLLVLTGWWFWRNISLYGDALGHSAHVAIAGNARSQAEPLALLWEWDGFVKSFWGVFGAFNVIFPDEVYTYFFILSLVVVFSILGALLKYRDGSSALIWFLAAAFSCNLLAVAAWTSKLLGSQGRLLFPTITVLAVLFAWSISRWSVAVRQAMVLIVSISLLCLSLYASLSVIPAQYPA